MFFNRLLASSDRYGASVSISEPSLFGSVWNSGKTDSGVFVNEYFALNLPVVYSCVGLIADSLAQLPIDVMQKLPDGTRKNLTDHPVAKLLNHEPNPYMSAFTLRQTQKHHVLLWGNGYQEIERDDAGRPVGLWPLLPDATNPHKPTPTTELYYQTSIAGKSFKLAKDNVLHVPALGYDGYRGYSPIQVARESLALGLALQKFGAKFFGNDAKSGGFIMAPGKLGDIAVKNIRDSLQEQGGIDQAHRLKVLEEGVKYISTTINPDDSQFLGSREFSIAEVARIFRVPLVLLSAMEKTSSFGKGIEQVMIGYVIWTLTPWVIRDEQELRRKLLTEQEKKDGIYLKYNMNALLRGDTQSRAQFYTSLVGRPIMTGNEARSLEDLNPLPGLDDVASPLNMGPSDKTPGTDSGAGADPADPVDDQSGDATPIGEE